MTRTSIALCAAAALMGAAASFIAGSQDQGRKGIVANRRETFFRYPTGEQVKTEQSVFAIRADGSQADVTQTVDAYTHRTAEQKTIFDVAKRQRIVVDSFTESVTTTPMSDAYVARFTDPRRPCSNHPLQEAGTFLGHRVQKLHIEHAFPDEKTLVQTTWFAPDLNCLQVKFVGGLKEPGRPLVITNIREVTSIKQKPPDEEAFAVPADYAERSPSEVAAEYNRRYLKHPDGSNKRYLQRLDEIYSSGRPLGQSAPLVNH